MTNTGGGYWLVARDGGIFSFGDAQGDTPAKGSLPSLGVAISKHRWHGRASQRFGVLPGGLGRRHLCLRTPGFFGSMGRFEDLGTAPIAGMAVTPDGGGYWMVASDGGMFAFGDAHFYGSMGGKPF